MLDRRQKLVALGWPSSWLRSRTGQLLAGLGFAMAPQAADAARRNRRQDDQERKNDDSGGNQDEGGRRNRDDRASEEQKQEVSSESNDSSEKSGKRDRNDRKDESDQSSEQAASDGDKNGNGSRRRDNSESSSDDSSSDDDSSGEGRRRARELEQEADEPAVEKLATTVPLGNPNVDIAGISTSPIADLVIDANDDVVASTSGGFAFAHSSDVIAISGPDGASIVRTGDVFTGTDGGERPDDGGNNTPEFLS